MVKASCLPPPATESPQSLSLSQCALAQWVPCSICLGNGHLPVPFSQLLGKLLSWKHILQMLLDQVVEVLKADLDAELVEKPPGGRWTRRIELLSRTPDASFMTL